MPKYIATFTKEWIETGEIEFEADDADDAEEMARSMLADNDEDIEWSDLSPDGDQRVESVIEIENEEEE